MQPTEVNEVCNCGRMMCIQQTIDRQTHFECHHKYWPKRTLFETDMKQMKNVAKKQTPWNSKHQEKHVMK